MLDLRIRVFINVYELRSFTLAGKALFMTQSAVSQHIKRLEDDMGTELIKFQRTQGKKVLITKHGEIPYQHASRVLNAEHEVLAEMARIKNAIPESPPPKRIEPLCKDIDYITGHEVGKLISRIANTNTERRRLIEKVKNNPCIRKKLYVCGIRNYIYYHADDIMAFLDKLN